MCIFPTSDLQHVNAVNFVVSAFKIYDISNLCPVSLHCQFYRGCSDQIAHRGYLSLSCLATNGSPLTYNRYLADMCLIRPGRCFGEGKGGYDLSIYDLFHLPLNNLLLEPLPTLKLSMISPKSPLSPNYLL